MCIIYIYFSFHLDVFNASLIDKQQGVGSSFDKIEGCLWCGQNSQPNTYVLPLKNGQRKFCTEACLFEFRKGACPQCGDAILGPPVQSTKNSVSKDFCSEKCLMKYKRKEEMKDVKLSPTQVLDLNKSPVHSSPPNTPTLSTSLASTPSGSASFLNSNVISFSWEEYLVETSSSAAPQKCFKQVSKHTLHNYL